MTQTRIRFCDVGALARRDRRELEEAMGRVLQEGACILGPVVEAFEKAVAHYLRTPYAIGVASGTDALTLALAALGVGPGDEVIVPANVIFADVEAILWCGATPVPADIDTSGHLCPRALAPRLTEHTRAIVFAHLHGGAGPIEPILAMAKKRGIAVVEDACQAFGASRAGRAAGTFGDVGCVSFYPTKVLGGLGDGGMIFCRDPKLATRLRSLRRHGADPHDKYRSLSLGMNSRLDALQAAALQVRLQKLDADIAKRQSVAQIYHQKLLAFPTWRLPAPAPQEHHTFYAYPIVAPSPKARDALRNHLAQHNIEAPVHFPIPVHHQPAYLKRFGPPCWPLLQSEIRARQLLCLPTHPVLQPNEIERVCHTLCSWLETQKETS